LLVEQNIIPYRALARIRATTPQFLLKKIDRIKNVKSCFKVVQTVKNKNIVLLEDVVTSGATVSEAALTLKKEGALSISVLALSWEKWKFL
jgi:competence protein ComFC